MPVTNNKKLLIGKINGFFGVNGWIKILSYSDPRDNILSYKPWHLQINNSWQQLKIAQGRKQSKTIVAQIDNINNRDQANYLLGANIYITQEQLPLLPTDKYYWHELIGLEVINKQQIKLGKVTNLFNTGANNVLIIKGEKQHLVPYIAPFLISVNMDKKQILVDWDEDF